MSVTAGIIAQYQCFAGYKKAKYEEEEDDGVWMGQKQSY